MLLFRNLIRSDEDPVVACARRWVQTQRILREFPWLWAVRDSWSPHATISIEDLNPEHRYGRLRDLTWWTKVPDWWIKIRTVPDDIHTVRKLDVPYPSHESGPARVIHESVTMKSNPWTRNTELVEYIVHKMLYPGREHYSVYRVPKKWPENLNQICARLATESRN